MGLSSDRWPQLEALFYEAVALDPAARKSFLDDHCGSDAALRQEVESLLASADQPIDFLEKPIQAAAQKMVANPRGRALQPGTRFARYEIISVAGAGGMGEVYLARDTQLKRNVALKLLAPELTRDERGLRRFEQEAQAASALNHPNILTVYEFGEVDGMHYIATEFIDGETLRKHIKRGRIENRAALDISIQITSALAAAHAQGIVHRDIKPDNVIVRKDGIVKVLDFGIAKLSENRGGISSLSTVLSTSQPGAVLGTVRYMSPEQARGQVVDGRSDLFSLSVVMYEMVTGHAAFAGETASDVIAEILKGEPEPLATAAPNLPDEFKDIIEHAMRKNRDQRHQSANELLAELQALKKKLEFQDQLQKAASPPSAAAAAAEPGSGSSRSASNPSNPAISPAKTDRFRTTSRAKLIGGVVGILIAAGIFAAQFGIKKWGTPPEAATTHTLAVLPFRNLRPDPQTDFLGYSLADAIINKLGYVRSLTVRPSSSVDKYRNQVVDPRRVATDLHVDTLLTGSFLRDGDDLRITTQLIDVKPDKILWQDTIDLKYDRLLTVQDTVSQQILKGLEVRLSPAEQENLKPEHAVNSQAYEYYLRGVDLYALNDFPAAISMLEKSVAIDPNYAPTWAHLGRAYTTNASLQFGGREQYAKAQAAYEKSIALNPALIEVRIYMANLLTDTGRVEQAVPLLREVLKNNPGYAEAHWELGYAYRFGGALKESVEECELARQNNRSVKINSSAMNAYLYLGQYDKFHDSLPLNDSLYILFYHGFVEYHTGNKERAMRDFDRVYELDPTLLPANVGKALSDDIKGNRAEGLALLRETEHRIVERGVSDSESLYKVAQAYAELGDKDSALRMFRRTIEGGFFPYPYFERDPLLQNIRNEPEFQRLMKQARERYDQFRARFFPT
jgi:serine/threonine protein kinase/tetratricopeptide (TPR) repeat protein